MGYFPWPRGWWGAGCYGFKNLLVLNFCLCHFLYCSINFCTVQYDWSFFCIYLFHKITKQKSSETGAMCHIPSSGNPFLMTEPITLHSIWVIFFVFFLWPPALAMINEISFLVLKSYHWLLNPHGLHRSITVADVFLYAVLCIHHIHHWWLQQLWCSLNKDSESVDDDWRKYPIILFDAVLQSLSSFLIFWRPCFCNLGKPQCRMVTCDSVVNTWHREPVAIMHRSYLAEK